MARKKIDTRDKKQRISIVVSPENFNKIKHLSINGSKFISWLLEVHFNNLESGGK